MELNFAKPIPYIKADLNASLIRLQDFQTFYRKSEAEAAGETEGESEQATAEPQDRKLFSDEPLDLKFFDKINGRL